MMYHVTSEYKITNPDTARRVALAKSTWVEQLWREMPIDESDCRRLKDEVGCMPFIKDILHAAVSRIKPDDIVVFTNLDICTSRLCSVRVACAMQCTDAVYSFRRDFGRLDRPLSDDAIPTGYQYCGSDLYAFRVSWWQVNKDRFPDMLLGREAWDAVLRIMMDLTSGGVCSEIKDVSYHERHKNTWEPPGNRYRIKGQLHNRHLARLWMTSNGFDPRAIGL